MESVESASLTESRVVTPTVPDEVISAISRMQAPIVIAHVVPDADALGAMFAIARALTSERCRTCVSLPEGSLSRRLRFMFETAHVRVADHDDFAQADGFIVTDTAKKPRCNVEPALKKGDWTAGRPIVNIDHHHTNTRFGDVDWIVADAGSTCELVYYLLVAASHPIDAATASLLYAGIQTDTMGFSLPSTRASALHAAADLVARGADVGEVGHRLYHSQHKSEFDLLRVVYTNTRTAADGQIAFSSASYDEIHDAGCSAADIDEQISVPQSLNGARLAMLFTEGNKGKTRINFRGSGNVTVADLAAEFNGGGHSQAAGAILDCGLEEAIATVVRRAIEHLKKFDP